MGQIRGQIKTVHRKNPYVSTFLFRPVKKYGSLLTALPAAFMSAVSATYILMAEEGFRLSAAIACPIGAGFALVLLCAYVSVFLARVKTASRTENWRRS